MSASALIVAPVAIPLLAGALSLLAGERRRALVTGFSLASTLGLLACALALLVISDASPTGVAGVLRLGDWPAPFAITLVADRLSAMMLLLAAILGGAALLYALAHWSRAGVYFHPLFQFLLTGVNGAFLTGDLFNLFVFFELLLAASYGLALHGSGMGRVKAGLHYVAINLAASLLFLIGVALIYAVSGTLNMADLAARGPSLGAQDRTLLEAGAAILGLAFLVKAGMWPLCFWLPATYASAAPPVAAMFAIMTKVGAYALLRLSPLLFGSQAGASSGFGADVIFVGGVATIAFGAIGMLAAQDNARLASHAVIVSAGTLIAAVGVGRVAVTGGALFYLVSSTLGVAAFFLLVELMQRGRDPGADVFAVTREAYGEEDEPIDEDAQGGPALPGAMSLIGLAFIGCAALVAGLPPLSGFLAKVALIGAAFEPTLGNGTNAPASAWALLVALLASGLAALIALGRAGIQSLWAEERAPPRIRAIEFAPIALLLALTLAQTIYAGPAMRYMHAAALSLHAPSDYLGESLKPVDDRVTRSRGAAR